MRYEITNLVTFGSVKFVNSLYFAPVDDFKAHIREAISKSNSDTSWPRRVSLLFRTLHLVWCTTNHRLNDIFFRFLNLIISSSSFLTVSSTWLCPRHIVILMDCSMYLTRKFMNLYHWFWSTYEKLAYNLLYYGPFSEWDQNFPLLFFPSTKNLIVCLFLKEIKLINFDLFERREKKKEYLTVNGTKLINFLSPLLIS